jgi:hypothetical protein
MAASTREDKDVFASTAGAGDNFPGATPESGLMGMLMMTLIFSDDFRQHKGDH